MYEFEHYLETEARKTFTSEAMHRLIKQDHRRSREEKKLKKRESLIFAATVFFIAVAIFCVAVGLLFDNTQALEMVEEPQYFESSVRGDAIPAHGYASIEEMKADGEYAEYEHSAVFTVTYYCGCSVCCGKWTDNSESEAVGAAGKRLEPFVSVAVDTTVIPLGTELKDADGRLYRAEDTGSAIKGNRIDIFTGNHEEAKNLGVAEMVFYW